MLELRRGVDKLSKGQPPPEKQGTGESVRSQQGGGSPPSTGGAHGRGPACRGAAPENLAGSLDPARRPRTTQGQGRRQGAKLMLADLVWQLKDVDQT